MKILAIDVGNTTIKIAAVSPKRTKILAVIETVQPMAKLRIVLARQIKNKKIKNGNYTSLTICSVVPKVCGLLKRLAKKNLDIPVCVVGEDIKVPMTINYKPKASVGQDRLVGAYAARCLYGSPAIVIDLGTAITFDIINGKGHYNGGIIVPGIRLSAETLFSKTAMLPNIDVIQSPKALIGKSTKESILSGLFNGYGAMCSGLIDRLKQGSLKKAKVIITGGHTRVMKKYIASRVDCIDEDLVFRGMYCLHKIL